MAEQTNDNKQYTAQDFERYYAGKMSPLEMHQLEKAAMEDPFLADALEGYGYAQTPVEDSEYLHTQIQSKAQSARVVSLQRFNKILRIAALFILLAGCGWVVYQFGFNRPSNDIAVLKRTNAPVTSTSDSNKNETGLEQTIANSDTNTQTTTVNSSKEGTVSLTTQNRHTGQASGNVASVLKEKAGDDVLKAQTKPANEVKREQTFSLQNKEISEGAMARDMKQSNNDTDVTASAQQTVTPGKENVIVMQRNRSAAIPEVVLGKSMKDSNYRKAHVTFEEAVPEKGITYYDDYVARNLQVPEDNLQKNISGEVRLAFDINDSGQAVNITVEKSLCEACDKEAVRLVQEGPKWVKKKKSQKGRVSIKF